MQPVSPDASRYDGTTMLFHWLTAGLVAAQWLGAQTIDWFPSGPLRVDARSLHIMFGVVLAFLIVARLVWRATGGRRLPLADQGALNIVAKGTHWGLYLLVVAMVAVGIALTWVRGDNIFGLFKIPTYDPAHRKALADQVQDIHGLIGYLILGLAGLHAAAALVHRYVWHDGVLARMLPGAGGSSAPAGVDSRIVGRQV